MTENINKNNHLNWGLSLLLGFCLLVFKYAFKSEDWECTRGADDYKIPVLQDKNDLRLIYSELRISQAHRNLHSNLLQTSKH